MIEFKYGSFLLLCTTMLLPAFASAQDAEERSYLAVRQVTTHASGTQTWVEQQAKLAAAHKENGDPARHVWQQAVGELDTFHIVTFPEAIGGGGGEGPALGEEWAAVISPTVQSRRTHMNLRYPDLNIPGGEDQEFIHLRYTYVAPGKNNAYHAWLRDKIIPALKAGGAEGVTVSRVILGGDTNTWVMARRMANPAVLNEPGPMAELSDEERAELFAGYSDIVWGTEVRILRFRADLSNDGPEEE